MLKPGVLIWWRHSWCTGEVDADTAIVPADVLSKQALEGQAEDLALEDTLYSLDKALQGGSITSEVYVKQVQLLTPSGLSLLCRGELL